MRAAVLDEARGAVEIRSVQVDKPAPYEILVRTAATGVCHSDLHAVLGDLPWPLPAVLGHEAAGVVEAVGSNVTTVQPGDHVVTCLSAFCGTCSFCLAGRSHLCQKEGLTRQAGTTPRLTLGAEVVGQFAGIGSFAEQMLVHENATVQVPTELPLEIAALLGCGVTTGLGAVFNSAQVKPGQTVAVIGCGGIGLNTVQGAHLAGAARVIAIDISDDKLRLARDFGATDVVHSSVVDPVEAVLELTNGGVQHAFEAIGHSATISQAFRMLGRGGTATVIGVPKAGASVEFPAAGLLHERRIQGSFMGGTSFRAAVPAYAQLYLQGRLKLDELIGGRASLDDLDGIFTNFTSSPSARQVVVFDIN